MATAVIAASIPANCTCCGKSSGRAWGLHPPTTSVSRAFRRGWADRSCVRASRGCRYATKRSSGSWLRTREGRADSSETGAIEPTLRRADSSRPRRPARFAFLLPLPASAGVPRSHRGRAASLPSARESSAKAWRARRGQQYS
jgi:hypothetical protein